MKKFLSLILLLVAIITTVRFTANVAKAEVDEFKSKSVYLCDYNTGTTLVAHNENERLPIASMCKIMTLLIIFDEIECGAFGYNDRIAISKTASGMGGSQAYLEAQAEYAVSDLIKSIVIASANDSCVAFAERISGSESAFVERMNKKAKEIGMKNTLFSNCTGLPKPTQYSCAKDVSIMFSKLLSHSEYFKFSNVRLFELKHPKDRVTQLTNTNKLINNYAGCDAGKTGFTCEAGHCFAATANRGNMRLISVVVSAPDSKTRFNETQKMLDYGFANFINKHIVDKSVPLDINANVKGGLQNSVEVIPQSDFYYFSKKTSIDDFKIDFVPSEIIKAPLAKGDVVGELIVVKNGERIASIPCVSNENIDKKIFFNYVCDVVDEWAI